MAPTDRVPDLGERWQTRAFGVDLTGEFAAPGLIGAPQAGTTATPVYLVGDRGLDAVRPVRRLAGTEEPGAALEIHELDDGSVLLDHQRFGRFAVRGDGTHVVCAPRTDEPWIWQRFLVGQVLPLVAVLRHLEVLHASAACIGGRAVLLAGSSGAGKTTAALGLLTAGATFLADDVAALAMSSGEVIVEAGPGLVSLDEKDTTLVSEVCAGLGGRVLGRAEGEVRLTVPAALCGAPVGVVILLDPRPQGDRVRFEPLEAGVARRLLGLTFNAYLLAPSRLVRQLDLMAALVAQARIYRAEVPRTLGPHHLRDAVLERCLS